MTPYKCYVNDGFQVQKLTTQAIQNVHKFEILCMAVNK